MFGVFFLQVDTSAFHLLPSVSFALVHLDTLNSLQLAWKGKKIGVHCISQY